MTHPPPHGPRVIIVGGGFGGISAAKALARAPVDVLLVDRRNHHLFQPLLYQVATAALSPANIASPIRHVLNKVRNCRVVLAEVIGVDLARQRLLVEGAAAEYDWLILAAGATHSYFGRDEWEAVAPGLKTLEDATEIRRRILLAFETAEYEGNAAVREALLTFVVIGGGPTGVELAGAIKEIATRTIAEDFRNIDTKTTRVILLEGGDRLLPQFPPDLSKRARRDLESLGVEVRLKSLATDVTREGVRTASEFIAARTIFWGAGVAASPMGRTLGVPLDRAGRVLVEPDLTVPGYPNVFVIGDMAAAKSADNDKPVPGVAQGALQMGRYAAEIIAAEVAHPGGKSPRKPFVYSDHGSMATIGRAKAVVQMGRWHIGGLFAWLMWGAIHIAFLIGFRNRLAVLASWLWNWIIFARDARLITGDARIYLDEPRPGELLLAEEAQADAQNEASPPSSSP
ncbi:MAG: NAD(P)/FAD-dependent oxidoreductase [Pirellulales bacterium]|nr:NAD(P)/FAD-dependent oxidoreductase [Pirellulales bacterium]